MGSPASGRAEKSEVFGPTEKLRAGVFAVGAAMQLSALEKATFVAGGSRGATAAVGGPTVGSPQEKALVLERKEARGRFPGPALEGAVGHRSASPAIMAFQPDRTTPSLVSHHICIGSREDAQNLKRLKEMGVTHILNCAKQLPIAHPKEFIHERLELADTTEQDLKKFQPQGVRFLRHVEGCGGRALVHCIAGCSRSVSIVLLHLMESHKIRLKVAYDHVRYHRMVAQPNEGFRFQLATTEVHLFGSSSVSRDMDSIWNFYRWNEIKQTVPHFTIDPPRGCGCAVA